MYTYLATYFSLLVTYIILCLWLLSDLNVIGNSVVTGSLLPVYSCGPS